LIILAALLGWVGVSVSLRDRSQPAPAGVECSTPSSRITAGSLRENEGGRAVSAAKAASAERIGGHATMEPSAPLVPLSEQLLAREMTPEQRRAKKLEVLEEILADTGSFADLPEAERDRLALYAGQLATADTPFTRCWTPGTPREIVQAYFNVEQRINAADGFSLQALQPLRHWARTATNSSGQGTQGQPVTITWSIVPDGTPIIGDANDPSSLRARMASIYGGSATGDPTAQPLSLIHI
jgi:hypothetical protein